MRQNALVIDMEHWYSPELLRHRLPGDLVDQYPESINPLLEILRRNETRATFAILGTVAEEHPEIVKIIYEEGHEIASHAWTHIPLNELGREEFEKEIVKSINLLELITGERPIGFRAPSFSIDNSTKWAFDVLEKHGFIYDASIFPIKTMLYGVPNAPKYIYRPSKDDITRNDPKGKIIEFPMNVLNLGVNIPFAGGFYFRILPLAFIKYAIRKTNEDMPVIFYIHPWETWPKTPQLNLPLLSRFITYFGINGSLEKFEDLVKTFKFSPIKDVLISYYSAGV